MKFRKFNQFIFFFLIIFSITIINFDSSQINEKTIKNSDIIIPEETYKTTWNNGSSTDSEIFIDSSGDIHIIWSDQSEGPWGTDQEIFYNRLKNGIQNYDYRIISDGYNGFYWNDNVSTSSSIFVDSSNKIHVVWYDYTEGPWGNDTEIMYVSYSEESGWSNATVISDGFEGYYWNDGDSDRPTIAVEQSGTIHVVWYDYTEGYWGNDTEIMHVSSEDGILWSNVTIISDGYGGYYWNNQESIYPDIEIDNLDKIHVVWKDYTDGYWGNDTEIMYASSVDGISWSNATVISDGYNGTYWNNVGGAGIPDIICDNSNKIHVVYSGIVNDILGSDNEIMYVSSEDGISWSNRTIISDGYNGTYWNNGDSRAPRIEVDNSNRIHVVWLDTTEGYWGNDSEIMYISSDDGISWSNVTIISDGYGGVYWNNDYSEYPDIAIDNMDNLYVIWCEGTDGIWGTDTEIMLVTYSTLNGWSNVTIISDRLVPFVIIPPYQNYFYINLVLSLISLGILWVLILINKKIQTGNYSIKTKQLTNISIITGASLLIVPQVTQIQYNSSINLGENLLDSFIFVFPWVILFVCILIILISVISLLITLDEYKSYVRKKTIYSKPFHNISFEDIFENENRRKIIRYILAEPGIHYNDLQRKCSLTPGQIRWHLNILLEYHIIKKDRLGQYTIFSPNISDLEYENYNKKVIRSKTSLDILDMIEEKPGVIPSDLANNLDLKKSTISYHINKLKKKGFIYSRKEGRELKIFLYEK